MKTNLIALINLEWNQFKKYNTKEPIHLSLREQSDIIESKENTVEKSPIS